MMMMHRQDIYLSMAVIEDCVALSSQKTKYTSLYGFLQENPGRKYRIIYLITDADYKSLDWADDHYNTAESAIAAIEAHITQEALSSFDSLQPELLPTVMAGVIHKICANSTKYPQDILQDVTIMAKNAVSEFLGHSFTDAEWRDILSEAGHDKKAGD